MLMSTNTEEKFGSDMGLMHQVVLAGRETGMDHTAWSVLAHNKTLLAQVAELTKQALEVSAEDRMAVTKWIGEIAGTELPYRESESYYPHSSHSNYHGFLQNCHGKMKELFWKAQHNQKARELCKEIEILFVLAYCYSALRMAVYEPEVNSEYGRHWFHPPLYGFHVAFSDIFEDDGRTCPGWFNTTEYFKANEAAIAVKVACEVFKASHDAEYNWPSEEAKAAAVRQLYDVCCGSRDNQKQKVLQLIVAAVAQ